MSTFLQVLLGSLVAFVLLLLVIRAAGRWVFRRIRQSVATVLRLAGSPGRADVPRRTGGSRPRASKALGQSVVASASVRVRASLPGRGRQVALVRRALREDVRGAAQALSAGRVAQRPVQGLQTVMAQLSEQARALDVDLAVIGHEPDRRARQDLLASQGERIAALRRACGEVRRAVLLAGSLGTVPLLRTMEDDLEDEVVALALHAHAYAELTGL